MKTKSDIKQIQTRCIVFPAVVLHFGMYERFSGNYDDLTALNLIASTSIGFNH